jgi:uracil DNA glycosylase
LETQWFASSKEVQNTKVISKVLASVFWGKDGVLLVDYIEKCSTITAKSFVALLDKMKPQTVSRPRGKLSKIILLLQGNSAPHKAAITLQKLPDIHSEVLKLPTYSPDLATTSFITSRNTSREETFRALRRSH